MKSAIDWFKELGVPFDGDITIKDIINIQEDAFDAGRVEGLRQSVCIVSSRTVPPKNEAYTRAIEESVVFLKAEIERGGKPGENTTCSKNTP